jgi:Protein of unknown function (DUF3662)/FHA domain
LGFLDKFEKTLENKVTGLFSKTFKSGLEPLEIASAIKKEMDAKASILSRDRILVPNSYLVQLSPQDFERLNNLGEPLIEELSKLCSEHATKQRFQFGELLEVSLSQEPSLALGQLSVVSSSKKLEIDWVPVLEVAGVSHTLVGAKTTVGRDSTADIQIGDNGLSRKHFEILWDGSSAVLRDLGSTNGVKVQGSKIDQVVLPNGTAFSAGRTDFLFNVIARAK